MSMRRRLEVRGVYEGEGVVRLLEPVDLPPGLRLKLVIEPDVEAEAVEASVGVEGRLRELGLDLGGLLEALGAPEGLREALGELVAHMASSMAEMVKRDARLLELYRAAETLEPGRAAERIGPPPLDNDTWMLMLSDILTIMEKAGLFSLTQPVRAVANVRKVNPYDWAMAALRGDRGFLDHEAERIGADKRVVYFAAAALAEAVRRAVRQALGQP